MSVVVVVVGEEEGVVLLAVLAGFPGPRLSISHSSAGYRLHIQRHILIIWTQNRRGSRMWCVWKPSGPSSFKAIAKLPRPGGEGRRRGAWRAGEPRGKGAVAGGEVSFGLYTSYTEEKSFSQSSEMRIDPGKEEITRQAASFVINLEQIAMFWLKGKLAEYIMRCWQ